MKTNEVPYWDAGSAGISLEELTPVVAVDIQMKTLTYLKAGATDRRKHAFVLFPPVFKGDRNLDDHIIIQRSNLLPRNFQAYNNYQEKADSNTEGK